jgi:peptidoglycan/xylan/chitin deacetylase (PgdA/CDA1 family)
VALTFDDGPHPAFTSRILEILRAGGAKATFFVVGSQAERHPELLREILRRADELGNHTYSHRNLMRVSRADFLEELDRTRRIMEKAGARGPLLFRPPGGDFNDEVLSAAGEARYRTVLWTVLPKVHASPPPAEIAGRVLAEASDGGVILLHSGVENTIRALPGILEELRARGFRCVTVSELLSDPRPKDPRAIWLDAPRLPVRSAPPAEPTFGGEEAP